MWHATYREDIYNKNAEKQRNGRKFIVARLLNIHFKVWFFLTVNSNNLKIYVAISKATRKINQKVIYLRRSMHTPASGQARGMRKDFPFHLKQQTKQNLGMCMEQWPDTGHQVVQESHGWGTGETWDLWGASSLRLYLPHMRMAFKDTCLLGTRSELRVWRHLSTQTKHTHPSVWRSALGMLEVQDDWQVLVRQS